MMAIAPSSAPERLTFYFLMTVFMQRTLGAGGACLDCAIANGSVVASRGVLCDRITARGATRIVCSADHLPVFDHDMRRISVVDASRSLKS